MFKKELFALTVFLLLISASFAYAAGGGTLGNGNGDDSGNDDGNDDTNDDNDNGIDDDSDDSDDETDDSEDDDTAENNALVRCDNFEDRTSRIKCRLENRARLAVAEVDWSSEESCKNLREVAAENGKTRITRGMCVALYATSKQCYREDLPSEEREQCFRNAVGLTKKIGELTREEIMEKRDAIRQRAVLHLYNIQERIEAAQKNGTIDSEKAAEIIDLIVQIKEDIMNGEKTKAQIKESVQELKQKIIDARATA